MQLGVLAVPTGEPFIMQYGIDPTHWKVSLVVQSGIYPPSQKVPLLIQEGSIQLGILQESSSSLKQHGILPTPPIHSNLSGEEQLGTSPFIQKLPLLVQAGIIQFGVLLSKVILLMQLGIFEEEPIHLKSSSIVQSGTKPPVQYVPLVHTTEELPELEEEEVLLLLVLEVLLGQNTIVS